MSLLYMVCDPYANFLGRGPTPTSNPEDVDATGLQVSSTNANGDFAPARLVDRLSDRAYMPNATSSSYTIFRNVNLVADHAIKIGGVLGVAWTSYTPSVGTAAYQDVTVRAGELLQLLTTFSIDGGSTIEVQVQNLTTGHWLTTAGAWVAVSSGGLTNGQDAIVNTAAGSYTLNFTTESVTAFGETALATLRIYIWTRGAGGVQNIFTNLELIPSVNCAWVYGHNFTNQYIPTLETSSNGSAWTVLSTGAIRQPGLYFSVTPTISRWWRIKFAAVPIRNSAVTQPLPGIGEAFVGYASSPSRSQKWGWKEEEQWKQLRQTNAAGQSWAYQIATARMRQLSLTFAPYDTSGTLDNLVSLRTMIDDIWLRSAGGVYPVAFIARDARPDIVFGRLAENMAVTHALPNMQETSITLDPLPPPVVGP